MPKNFGSSSEELALGEEAAGIIGDLSEYYPGVDKVITSVGQKMKEDNFRVHIEYDYGYKVLEYSIRFDKEIKSSCANASD